ncbi:response regulator transcription factor [Amycolatopsis albispora]|uniref:DNA-binding response regulator n=1 Tax=Amycolatopsis albispora TaxID=1804986 RepID=A0A344L6R5_9PSEU|nr:response regulator transcription factor [Amycolatopsis albispora]AXB43739.1 DNA-binding response regulator [Amycolatopsis albispora]
MIRVLIADDEPLITAGIRTVLESDAGIEVVAEAADGRTAVELARAHRVDVAVLDLNMPELDGLSAVRELPGVPVVILTAFGVEPNVRRAIRQQVAGFVLKNCTPDELIRAVHAAHAGKAYLSPEVARLVLDMVGTGDDGRRESAAARLAALSPREAEVLGLLAEGLSNADIGAKVHMSEATIKTYVSRILSKLDCANRVQAALLARDGLG